MGKEKHDKNWPVLAVTAFEQIPLREVSGLAIAPLPRGTCLVAVGDHGPEVAIAPLDTASMTGWDVIDLSTLRLPEGAPNFEQAEAVAADGGQQVLVLIEDPALLLVLDTVNRRLTHAYRLEVGNLTGLGNTWAQDSASRGEGLVLMRDGHVLVLKEKRPAGLLEFGPEGDIPLGVSSATLHEPGQPWSPPDVASLVALAWWPVNHAIVDLSDADIGPDGSLYVVSDKSSAIAEVTLPLAVGDDLVFARVWALPDSIEKAEGLAFLPDGSTVVAVDRSDVGRNLATLPPVGDWP